MYRGQFSHHKRRDCSTVLPGMGQSERLSGSWPSGLVANVIKDVVHHRDLGFGFTRQGGLRPCPLVHNDQQARNRPKEHADALEPIR